MPAALSNMTSNILVCYLLPSTEARVVAESAVTRLRHRGFPLKAFRSETWECVLSRLTEHGRHVCLVDPFDQGHLQVHSLRTLLSHPSVPPVIAYGLFSGPSVPRDVQMITSLGISRVRSAGFDDTVHQISEDILASAQSDRLATLIDDLTRPLTPEQAIIVQYAVRNSARGLSVAEMAAQLSIPARTLRRWCDDLDHVSPGTIIRAIRTLSACLRLDVSHGSATRIVEAMGFSSYRDFARKYRALVGNTPSETRRGEHFTRAAKALRWLLQGEGRGTPPAEASSGDMGEAG